MVLVLYWLLALYLYWFVIGVACCIGIDFVGAFCMGIDLAFVVALFFALAVVCVV